MVDWHEVQDIEQEQNKARGECLKCGGEIDENGRCLEAWTHYRKRAIKK